MEDNVIYRTNVSWLFHILLLTILLLFSIIIDYKSDEILFSGIIYYIVPFIPLMIYSFISLFSYTKIILYKSGIEFESFFFRRRVLIRWDDIEKIVVTFSRFTLMTLEYRKNEKTTKKTLFFTYIGRKDLNNIVYLLHICHVNIECKGAISKNWKRVAIEKFQGLDLQIDRKNDRKLYL